MVGNLYSRDKASDVYTLDMLGVGNAEANNCSR